MRSTNSAPDCLSNSYFTGSPPVGTSMITLRLSGGLSPVGIYSMRMAAAPRPGALRWRGGICALVLAGRAARAADRRDSMHVGLATGFAYQGRESGSDSDFIREEVDHLLLAEELGFDSVWITEHHFSDYSMSNDPVQLLTYIAGKT